MKMVKMVQNWRKMVEIINSENEDGDNFCCSGQDPLQGGMDR